MDVVISNPDSSDPEANKSKPGVFNVYSMDIKNIGGKNVKNVRVEAFRDAPNKVTKYELFTAEEKNLLQHGSFHHQNFPISINAKELIVIITWSEKGIDSKHERKYKEQFVFEQK